MSIPGVTGTRAVSRNFFANTELDEKLFSALFAYRENTEELAAGAGIDAVVEFRNIFSLQGTFSEYDYAHTWSDEKFEQEPADVMSFLHNLEIDLRKYENRLLYEL